MQGTIYIKEGKRLVGYCPKRDGKKVYLPLAEADVLRNDLFEGAIVEFVINVEPIDDGEWGDVARIFKITCEHRFSKSMFQEFPRKCIKCGTPEKNDSMSKYVEVKEGGFFDLPENKACVHPEHEPPKHLHIPQGKGYRHVCPGCGKEQVIIPPQIRF